VFGIPGFLGFSPCNNEQEFVMISFNTEKQACQGELIQLLFRPQKHYKRAVACMGPSTIAFLGKTTVLIEPIATFSTCVI
jgi:hypothetical protein